MRCFKIVSEVGKNWQLYAILTMFSSSDILFLYNLESLVYTIKIMLCCLFLHFSFTQSIISRFYTKEKMMCFMKNQKTLQPIISSLGWVNTVSYINIKIAFIVLFFFYFETKYRRINKKFRHIVCQNMKSETICIHLFCIYISLTFG